MQPPELKVSLARLRSDDIPDVKHKVGIVIEYVPGHVPAPLPQSQRDLPPKLMNRRQSIGTSAVMPGSIGGPASIGQHFIQRAHLEVLKQENLEDQFLAKKMADIICSPRRLKH